MSPSIRNKEARTHVTVTEEFDGGYRIEEKEVDPAPLPIPAYGDYVRVLQGRTVCMPLSSSGDVPGPSHVSAASALPCPDKNGLSSVATNLKIDHPDYETEFGLPQGLNCELIPAEEIQSLWNQVLAESNRQLSNQTADEARRAEERKTKKLEMLLRVALNSGDIDAAMLLFSGLESKTANALAASLMQRMQQLQQERQNVAAGMTSTGDQAKDSQNAQSVNAKMGDISAELNLLQTFLQDVNDRKHETQQMASNYLKSRHDTGMGILRNMG